MFRRPSKCQIQLPLSLAKVFQFDLIIGQAWLPSSAQRTWIGVWLDAATGKSFHCRLEGGWPNSASFLRQARRICVSYFSCMPKHEIFVKADKLILDKRDRDLHSSRSSSINPSEFQNFNNAVKRSQSKAEGMSEIGRKHAVSGKFWFTRVESFQSLDTPACSFFVFRWTPKESDFSKEFKTYFTRSTSKIYHLFTIFAGEQKFCNVCTFKIKRSQHNILHISIRIGYNFYHRPVCEPTAYAQFDVLILIFRLCDHRYKERMEIEALYFSPPTRSWPRWRNSASSY